MRYSLQQPPPNELERFKRSLADLSFNYLEQGATQGDFPSGYDHDRNRCLLGQGEEVFAKAKQLLRNWQHFPKSWTKIYSADQEPAPGREVVVLFRLFGLWWKNGARVIYLWDEPKYLGFAYGTLPGHVERGEEIFYVEMDEQEQVFYGIHAFSRPDWWLVRLAYPLARYFQRCFVRDSMAQMQRLSS